MKKLLLTLGILSVFFLCGTAQSTNPAPYCNASFDDMQGFPVDDHIDLVSFGTLTNASNAQYPAPHYVFYNNLNAPAVGIGTTHTLKVKFTVAGSAGYGVWIDYNQNNIFDSTELVAGSTSSTSTYLALNSDSISVNVTIPVNAAIGNTRMRVRIVEDDTYHGNHGPKEMPCNADSTAANTMDWGETEDYTITIGALTGISETPSLSTVSLYPNPVNDMITLQMADHTDSYSYSILNILGQVMTKGSISGTKQSIDVSSLTEGIYLVKVANPATHTERILKFEKAQ